MNPTDELFQAVANNDLVALQTALRQGAAPDSRNEKGCTPLYLAAENNQAELITALLQSGADPNEGYAYSKESENSLRQEVSTPLYLAAEKGHQAAVKALIAGGADLNKGEEMDYFNGCADLSPQFGKTPLLVACERGHEGVVIELLKAGVDPNRALKENLAAPTPLAAAYRGRHNKVMAHLLDGGALPVPAVMKALGRAYPSPLAEHLADFMELQSECKREESYLEEQRYEELLGIRELGDSYYHAKESYEIGLEQLEALCKTIKQSHPTDAVDMLVLTELEEGKRGFGEVLLSYGGSDCYHRLGSFSRYEKTPEKNLLDQAQQRGFKIAAKRLATAFKAQTAQQVLQQEERRKQQGREMGLPF